MIDLILSPTVVPAGSATTVVIAAKNDGPGVCNNLTIRFAVLDGLLLVGGSARFTAARLAEGEQFDHHITVVAQKPGDFRIRVVNFSFTGADGRPRRITGGEWIVQAVQSEPEPDLAPKAGHDRSPSIRGKDFTSYGREGAQELAKETEVGDPGQHGQPGGADGRKAMARLSNIPSRPKAFLCHSSGDKERVRDLYRRLTKDGIACWFDEEDLLPGQDWQYEIRKALRSSSHVLACLSSTSINKVGYIQRELREALDLADEQPEGSIFLIPARLEECEIPDRLNHLHWVDLFKPEGYDRLLRAVRAGKNIQ